MTQRFVQHGPHPPPRLHKQLSHHVQISFLWLAGTPPPSPPSICSSCQLSNAFGSGKDTPHKHRHTHTSLAAMSGTPDCPTLTNMSEMKVTAWWKKEREKKKKNTYRAVFAIKAGVVSFENVAFLKIVRPVILDVLWEFLIGSVGGGIHESFSGSLIPGRCWQQHMLTSKRGRKPTYLSTDCNKLMDAENSPPINSQSYGVV